MSCSIVEFNLSCGLKHELLIVAAVLQLALQLCCMPGNHLWENMLLKLKLKSLVGSYEILSVFYSLLIGLSHLHQTVQYFIKLLIVL